MLTNLKTRHSACYDMQQICTYLQLFSHCKSHSGKITSF